jgi:hypothetical protein
MHMLLIRDHLVLESLQTTGLQSKSLHLLVNQKTPRSPAHSWSQFLADQNLLPQRKFRLSLTKIPKKDKMFNF